LEAQAKTFAPVLEAQRINLLVHINPRVAFRCGVVRDCLRLKLVVRSRWRLQGHDYKDGVESGFIPQPVRFVRTVLR
jgi:hypothetical protein